MCKICQKESRGLYQQTVQENVDLKSRLAVLETYDGQRVKTAGPCTPGAGIMLTQRGSFAWVLFDGSDAPVTWPLKYLRQETAGACFVAEAAE